MVIEELFSGCLSVLACLRFNIHTLYYCVKKLNYKLFLPQVSSWVPFYRGSTRRWGHNDVKCRFGSYSIHKPNSRTRVLVLEVQVLFIKIIKTEVRTLGIGSKIWLAEVQPQKRSGVFITMNCLPLINFPTTQKYSQWKLFTLQ